MTNPITKFEVSSFTHSTDIEGIPKFSLGRSYIVRHNGGQIGKPTRLFATL